MKTIHFVGIGGIGMSALARYMIEAGWSVSGSDRCDSALIGQLASMGATVHIGHSAGNIPDNCQLVVYTSAVSVDNVELASARASGCTVILREQLLGQIFNSYSTRVAVCGTHGKTTTTAMLDYVLRHIGVRHTAFIGGMPVDSHSNCSSGGRVVVAEACEYRESFRHLFANIVVCLNIEWDHPDYYSNIHHMQQAYGRFFGNCDSSGTIVAHQSVPQELLSGRSYVTYGTEQQCTYRAVDIAHNNGMYSYNLLVGGVVQCTVSLSVVGRHNVDNSLAVLATCLSLGIDCTVVAKALSTFFGAERRWQVMPCNFTNVVEDYAHHPTELLATISTARDMGYSRIIVVFQPHTYSRTMALWRQFVQVLGTVDMVVLLPIYSAREQPIVGCDSLLLARAINVYTTSSAHFMGDIASAYDFVRHQATPSDIVLVLGAGDVNELSNMFYCS